MTSGVSNEENLVKMANGASNELMEFPMIKLIYGCEQQRVLVFLLFFKNYENFFKIFEELIFFLKLFVIPPEFVYDIPKIFQHDFP